MNEVIEVRDLLRATNSRFANRELLSGASPAQKSNVMKDNRNIFTWILLALLLLGGGLGWYKYYQANQTISALVSESKILSDNLGRSLAERDVAVVSRNEFTRLFKSEQAKVAAMGVNPSSVRYITRIETVTNDSIVFQTLYDTVMVKGEVLYEGRPFKHADQWVTLNVEPGMFGWWSLDYTVRDTIDLVLSETNRFFGKKYQITGSSANPNTVVYGLDGLVIDEKKKRFGIGLQVGYGATWLDNKVRVTPYVGAGLHYSLVRW